MKERKEGLYVWVCKLHTTRLTAVKLPTVQSAWELSSRSHPLEFHSCMSTIQNHTKINEIHTADGGSGRDIHLPKHLCFLCTSCCSHTQRVVVRRDILKYSCASWGTYRGGQAFWCSSCYCYYIDTISSRLHDAGPTSSIQLASFPTLSDGSCTDRSTVILKFCNQLLYDWVSQAIPEYCDHSTFTLFLYQECI